MDAKALRYFPVHATMINFWPRPPLLHHHTSGNQKTGETDPYIVICHTLLLLLCF
uniref:Uncharacterized protein n=1 Tax=Arundo donax TaxID=35708 RepID=A0A0A9EPH5_ARUDO